MQDFAKQKNYMQDVNRERGKFDPTISQKFGFQKKLTGLWLCYKNMQ
jgi:hypothetical protein